MRRVGLLYDSRFLEHEAPQPHPESPERLAACVEALVEMRLWDLLEVREARPATMAELTRIHDPEYVALIHALGPGSGWLEGDTYFGPESAAAAEAAAGGSIQLVADVMSGGLDAGLALVRPPGHHAEKGRAMGFCLFNNIALAAAYARDRGERVAIVDFDVHHGNGTQQAFYEDPAVLFCSMHRHGRGFYPGTGAADEVGAGAGKGSTLNVPLPAGVGSAAFLALFDELVAPAVDKFAPSLLLVSAGFDIHARDPLGGLAVDDAGVEALLGRLGELAARHCRGRWVAVLEGGYDLPALARGVVDLVRALLV